MLSAKEKILLLDEVVNSARSSWQIYIIGDQDFKGWPESDRSHPAYFGYLTLKNILSVSLMTTCYSLVETGKRAYSFHHAVSDPALNVSSNAKKYCQACFSLRNKISKYRNNVTAHVNSKMTQADWAQSAGIKNHEIDEFLRNAKAAIEELARDNMEDSFRLGITMPVRVHFLEYCRVTTKIAHEKDNVL